MTRPTRAAALAIALSGCYMSRPAPSHEAEPSRPRRQIDAGQPRMPNGARDGGPSAARDPGKSQPDAAEKPQPDAAARTAAIEPEPKLRIAFLGDQSIGPNAQKVLELIQREGAHLVVHAGDLSYGLAEPAAWEAQINAVLGDDFPYVVAAGNHDLDDWEGPRGFAALLTARLQRTPSLRCTGVIGLNARCRFRGVDLLVSGVGTSGVNHEAFLEQELAQPGARFRFCVWHKNQRDLQVGEKIDEVGWHAYQICQRYGAGIITGHEHSYARTFTLTRLGERNLGHGSVGAPDLVKLAPGSTFVVVSGLGGHSARTRTADHEGDTWWASIYANDFQLQNSRLTGKRAAIDFGALFIDFNLADDPTTAHAYFKTTRDLVVDRFEIKAAP